MTDIDTKQPDETDPFSELRPFLLRATCPPADELGDYFLQLLDRKNAEHITTHLETCQHCQADIEKLQLFLGEESGDDDGYQLDDDDLLGWNAIAPLTQSVGTNFRGGKNEPFQLSFSIDPDQPEVLVFLELQRIEEDTRLRGEMLLGPEQETLMTGSIIEIWQHKKLVAVTTIEDGAFVCQLPKYETFILRLTTNSETKMRSEISLGQS